MITIGREHIIPEPLSSFAGKRLALLCNQASTDRRFRNMATLEQ